MKKIVLTLAIFVMSMATITVLTSAGVPISDEMDGNDPMVGGGRQVTCYITSTYQFASSPVYNVGIVKYCDFTGVYVPPIQCTQKQCGFDQETRKCVKG